MRLALSERFGRVRLAKNRAEYELPGQGVCGLRKKDRKSGLAHLDLFFSEQTAKQSRDLFTVFVEDHLSSNGVAIKEVLGITCRCGYKFDEEIVRNRIDLNHTDVICPLCETRSQISEGAKKARAGDSEIEKDLFALKSRFEIEEEREIREISRKIEPTRIFISYSHRDSKLFEELIAHLAALRREGAILAWNDRMIGAGDEWKEEIDQNLEAADLILLLVCAQFINSDYCYDIEMKRAMEKHEKGEARVIPVILSDADWTGAPFAKLQALPAGARPVTDWENRDKAFANIARGIRAAIEQKLRPELAVAATTAPAAERQIIWEPLAEPPIRILHLSDLHFAETAEPVSMWQPLVADLRDREGGLGFERLDYLVVSGDLTNRADPREFERVHQFISALIEKFDLSAQRCIIAPGNHDLSWEVDTYDWKSKRKVERKGLREGSFVEQGDGYLIREDGRYPARFENFGKFYHNLIQEPYPLRAEDQCLPFLFDDAKLQFLVMNSAWEIDEYFGDRSGINEAALSAGLAEAGDQIEKSVAAGRLAKDDRVLRLAVWHHPVTGNEKIAGDAFLSRLQQAGFKLCLHGHVHDDRADLIGYLHRDRKIHVAGAGSFGAPTSARPESTPRLYNLIEIERDHSRIRVHTRCLRKDGGAWEGWAVWPGGKGTERLTYYDIELRGEAG